MKWNSIKEKKPPSGDGFQHFLLAYHTIFGVGVGWFFYLEDWEVEELGPDPKDEYLVTCDFWKSQKNDNFQNDVEEEIHVFAHDPLFRNLGTVTHWMELPEMPEGALDDSKLRLR